MSSGIAYRLITTTATAEACCRVWSYLPSPRILPGSGLWGVIGVPQIVQNCTPFWTEIVLFLCMSSPARIMLTCPRRLLASASLSTRPAYS